MTCVVATELLRHFTMFE